MKIPPFFRLLLFGLISSLVACSSFNPPGIFRSISPYEQYATSLRTAHLDQAALGIDWLAAGNRALSDSLLISVPYRESGYFAAPKPMAIGYRVNMQRGDKLLIRVDVQGQASALIFIDVFELGGPEPVPIASARADTTTLTCEIEHTRMHLIRLQPELLRSGHYTISITREPLLGFPVQGRTNRQISSYFGEPREGGKRRHEGIDVFAPKGTPALASVDGLISGVGENRLGGHVVWLSDVKHEQRLYYAHLDRFNVVTGQHVTAGDTVGFIGNSGNARTLSPHLHFGLYTGDTALDPLPFVRLGKGPARQPLLATDQLNDTVRTTLARALLRLSPNANAPVVSILPHASTLVIAGGTANWLRVELPDGLTGYLANNQTEPIRKPLRSQLLATPGILQDGVRPGSAHIKELAAGSRIDVLGISGIYIFVKDQQGTTGWLPAS